MRPITAVPITSVRVPAGSDSVAGAAQQLVFDGVPKEHFTWLGLCWSYGPTISNETITVEWNDGDVTNGVAGGSFALFISNSGPGYIPELPPWDLPNGSSVTVTMSNGAGVACSLRPKIVRGP